VRAGESTSYPKKFDVTHVLWPSKTSPWGAAGKNHAFCRRTSPMSAEIAAGNFSQ
jgi:hypothetical protein